MKKLLLILMLFNAPAQAAEATIGIKVRIISCVTQEERVQMCMQEGHCCHLIEPDTPMEDVYGEYDEETDTWTTY